MTHLVFDLETKPFLGKRPREAFEIACAVGYEPANDRWIAYVDEDALRKMGDADRAFDGGEWARILPISDLSKIPWDRAIIVGHSLWHNDLPILQANLKRRALAAPEEILVIDTQRALERAGGGCVGLDRLGLANFGAARVESGRAASLAWARGDFSITIDHCRRDVLLTHQIFACLQEGDIRLPTEERIAIHPDVLVPEMWRLPEKKKRRRGKRAPRASGEDDPEDGAAAPAGASRGTNRAV